MDAPFPYIAPQAHGERQPLIFRGRRAIVKAARNPFSETLHRPICKRPAVTDLPDIVCRIHQGLEISDRSGTAVGFDRRVR